MRKIILAAIAIVVVSTAPTLAQSNRIENRESRQDFRIVRGAVHGELTGRETGKLLRQQDRIGRAQHKATRDGYVTRREANRIERMQDRASRNIARKTHNRRHY